MTVGGWADQKHLHSSPIRAETQVSTIEAAFQEYTERKDVAILLINQHVSASYKRLYD